MSILSVIGKGIVGNAIIKSFSNKKLSIYSYDKYKKSDNFETCLLSDIMFLCLPTNLNSDSRYNIQSIIDICGLLSQVEYSGLIIIKSTVEPGTTNILANKYKNLKFIHNPEFLTARTAYEDFHNQKHIVIGMSELLKTNDLNILVSFYKNNYPEADISVCSSNESEMMKISLNSFYAIKVQFFNELYLLSDKIDNCDYKNIVKLMLKNNWINPMHTLVPGPDGELSYGGSCLPKDTEALLQFMKKINTPHSVLQGTVDERNSMRTDNSKIYLYS